MWLLLLLALGLSACAKEVTLESQCPQIPEGLPITEEELAYLGALRAHHQAADLLETKGDLAAAQGELDQALALSRPAGAPSEEAYLDAAGRAVILRTRRGLPEEALALARQAATVASRDSFYLGALKMAEGEAHEAKGAALRAQGDPAAALAADERALDAYEASQAINGRVLERLTREPRP